MGAGEDVLAAGLLRVLTGIGIGISYGYLRQEGGGGSASFTGSRLAKLERVRGTTWEWKVKVVYVDKDRALNKATEELLHAHTRYIHSADIPDVFPLPARPLSCFAASGSDCFPGDFLLTAGAHTDARP